MAPVLAESTYEALMLSSLTGMDHAAETLALADLQILPDAIPFSEAINYMASKVPLTKSEYYHLSDQLRFRAFAVSRLTQVDAVDKVRKHFIRSMKDGGSLSEFQTQEGIDDALKVAGFDKSEPWYWETVYRTNIQTAYNTGRVMQYEKNPPEFLEFIGIGDVRQTDICRIRQGTILPYNDPWWKNNYPPLHFNCRSTVRAIYKEEAEIRSIKKTAVPEGDPAAKGFGENPVKSGNFYKLTPSMKERAKEYGIDTEFLTAAADANLPDYARKLVKEGLKPGSILFENISDPQLRDLAEEAMNPDIPLRSDAVDLVDQYKEKVIYRINSSRNCSHYDRRDGSLNIHPDDLSDSIRHTVFRHEFGHALDFQAGKLTGVSEGKEFVDNIKGVNKKLTGKNADDKLRNSVISFIDKYEDDPSISDLFCSITGCTDSALHGMYIHKPGYYTSYNRRATESFANLFDLYCVNDERWEFLQTTLPALAEGFIGLLQKL